MKKNNENETTKTQKIQQGNNKSQTKPVVTDTSENEISISLATVSVVKKKYTQKFRPEWLKKYKWLDTKNNKPFCKYCFKLLTNNKAHINRHELSKDHQNQIMTLKKQKLITDEKSLALLRKKEENIKIAELKIIMFLIKFDLAISLISPLIDLIKSIASDSHIASDLKCGRTKATETITNVLMNEGVENISKVLSKQKFSLLIDESTDISTQKCLAVVVRYFDFTVGKIKDRYLTMIHLTNSSAQSIYAALQDFFSKFGIPMQNCVGFSADNASNMMGQQGGVRALLLKDNPYLYTFGCICHSMHLCSSAAARKIPNSIENLAKNIYSFFSHSAKRQFEFTEFQKYFDVEVHKILKTASTRWLSLQDVVDRILEQWDALKYYFISCQMDGNNEAKQLLNEMTDNNKTYFLFLSYILKKTNRLNIEFQSESPKIHILLPLIKSYFQSILQNFTKLDYMNDKNCNYTDFNNSEHFKEINNIHLGAKAELFIEKSSFSSEEINEIKLNCRNYYIELCCQICKRINFNDQTLNALCALDPNNLSESLIQLISLFPNIAENEDVEEIEEEWKHVVLMHKNKNTASSDVELEDFWCNIFKMKNGLQEPMYPKLIKFVSSLLCFPHSSATVERIFSQLNLIKNKKRNALHIETVNAIMVCKEMLNGDEVPNWQPSKILISKYKKN